MSHKPQLTAKENESFQPYYGWSQIPDKPEAVLLHCGKRLTIEDLLAMPSHQHEEMLQVVIPYRLFISLDT